MANVFLSYAREDGPSAEKLAVALERSGHSVWWDHNLAGGERYLKTTESELAAAKAVVVLWSRVSVDSHWVADEAGVGRDDGRLIPISLDGALPPLGFRQFQVIDFSHWRSGEEGPFQSLLSALHRFASPVGVANNPVPDSPITSPPSWATLPRLILAAASIAFAALIAGFVFLGAGRDKVVETRPVASLAVLPFEALDSDPLAKSMASAVSAAISDRLTSAGLLVVAPKSDGQETAGKDSGAGFLVTGSVVRDTNVARVVARVVHAKSGLTVWSSTLEGQADRIGALADQLSVRVANSISWSGALRALNADTPNAPEFAAVYLLVDQRMKNGDRLGALEAARRLPKIAPEIAQAHVALAIEIWREMSAIPPASRESALVEGQAAAQTALKLDPREGGAFLAAMLTTPMGLWAERIDWLERGRSTDPANTSIDSFLSQLYSSTGQLDRALTAIQQARALDHFSEQKALRMARLFQFSGKLGDAKDLFDETERGWPDSAALADARFVSAFWAGTPATAEAYVSDARAWSAEQAAVRPLLSQIARALRTRQSKDIDEVETACAAVPVSDLETLDKCLSAMTILGRIDTAFAFADKLYPQLVGPTRKDTERLWLNAETGDLSTLFAPWMAPLRADPRAITIFERLGLADYWRTSGHWPDFCLTEPRSVCPAMKRQ